MTEGVGFEPTSPLTRANGFRDRPVQPLRHPSRNRGRLILGSLGSWRRPLRPAGPEGDRGGGEQQGQRGELGDRVSRAEALEVLGVEEQVEAGGDQPGDAEGADQLALEVPGGPAEENREAEVEAADISNEVFVEWR